MAESSSYKQEARSLGPGNLQASPGDHTHDGITSKGGWTDYTSTWTSTSTLPVLNNGTLSSAYLSLAKTVDFRIVLTMGSTTTYGAGIYLLDLPVAPSLAYPANSTLGVATIWDASGLAYRTHFPVLVTNGGITIKLLATNSSSWGPSFPFVPAVNDYVVVVGRYQVD